MLYQDPKIHHRQEEACECYGAAKAAVGPRTADFGVSRSCGPRAQTFPSDDGSSDTSCTRWEHRKVRDGFIKRQLAKTSGSSPWPAVVMMALSILFILSIFPLPRISFPHLNRESHVRLTEETRQEVSLKRAKKPRVPRCTHRGYSVGT